MKASAPTYIAAMFDNAFLKIIFKDGSTWRGYSFPVSPSNDETLTSEFRNILKRHQCHSFQLVLCIPRSYVLSRAIKLPESTDEEMRAMFDLETSQLFPIGPDQIATTYRKTPAADDGMALLDAYALPKKKRDRLLKIFSPWKSHIHQMPLSSETFESFLQDKNLISAGENQLFADISQNSLELLGLRKGNTVFTRSLELNAQPYENIIGELKRSSFAFHKLLPPGSEHDLTLIGDTDICRELKEQLYPAFPVSIHLFARIDTHAKIIPAALEGALMPKCHETNFLPLSLISARETETRNKRFLDLGLTIGVAVTLLAGALGIRFYSKVQTLQRLNDKIRILEPQTKAIQTQLDKLDSLRQMLGSGEEPLVVLRELTRLIPSSTSIQILDFDNEDGVTIHAQDRQFSRAVDLVETLEKSSVFSDVELISSNLQKDASGDVTKFIIHCPFKKETTKRGPA